ncbi:hypothetical protein OS493_032980 [Desmophyllum pertusum]|uniref:Uncharacterized protein n=1 Tax=Desmophyllum pertusum TaxID=174260 RepID=A0A9W9ZWH7_9CNID|nr:hypothetical protein OS493_032980 [Desmophyllum pertusum]
MKERLSKSVSGKLRWLCKSFHVVLSSGVGVRVRETLFKVMKATIIKIYHGNAAYDFNGNIACELQVSSIWILAYWAQRKRPLVLDGSDPDVSYFGSVNFTEGWCSGTKAAHFSQPESYATVPNVNITDGNVTIGNFTIACWIRRSSPPPGSNVKAEQSIITVSSVSGKSFVLTCIESLEFGYIGGAAQLSSYVFCKNCFSGEIPFPCRSGLI